LRAARKGDFQFHLNPLRTGSSGRIGRTRNHIGLYALKPTTGRIFRDMALPPIEKFAANPAPH